MSNNVEKIVVVISGVSGGLGEAAAQLFSITG